MTAPELVAFALVLLRRPDDAPELPEEELDRIHAGHLAHLQSLRERGVLAAAGPFRDQDDERLRGRVLLRCGVDEARSLVADDPAIRAGRLVGDVLTWLVRAEDVPIASVPGT